MFGAYVYSISHVVEGSADLPLVRHGVKSVYVRFVRGSRSMLLKGATEPGALSRRRTVGRETDRGRHTI